MKTQKQQGFTIIEVVLVLAIAGLIFLVVFLALPALQTGQRDDQRTRDLSRLQTAIESYRSNNKNNLPLQPLATATVTNSFVENYLRSGGESFDSPSGTNYTLTRFTGSSPVDYDFNANPNTIFYRTGAKCGDSEGTFVGAGQRDYLVFMHLEGGGIACQNN